MIGDKKNNIKLRVVSSVFIFSIILMLFPVTTGVIVAINHMNTIESYYIQGILMMLSITIPAIFMLITKIKLSQIGFTEIKKGSLKTVLYFIPLIAAKLGFLFYGINKDVFAILALVFFTIAIGLSEEIYFRGIILRRLLTCFSIKQTVVLSSVFFAVLHASQAFSGVGIIMTVLTIINALIFGIVASEIVLLTNSIIFVVIWHTMYDFVNWITLVKGVAEVMVIIIQSVIMIIYAIYLWNKRNRLIKKSLT